MDALMPEELYTIDDIYALPEGERAELIDGRIYYMASPSRLHQQILGSLYRKIADYIDSHGVDCEVYMAPFAVFLNNDKHTYVEPDISVVCDKDKLDDRGCNGAPDWIIEIVSPISRSMDCLTKLLKYQNAGVREYWITDPANEQVMVYNFEKQTMAQYSFGENVPVGIYEGFVINMQPNP